MPSRKRTLSPTLFENEDYMVASPAAKLVWPGLWTICDRNGVFEWRPKKWTLKFAHGIAEDPEQVFMQFVEAGWVVRFERDGVGYGFCVAWAKWQNPHINEAPAYPLPEDPRFKPCVPRAWTKDNSSWMERVYGLRSHASDTDTVSAQCDHDGNGRAAQCGHSLDSVSAAGEHGICHARPSSPSLTKESTGKEVDRNSFTSTFLDDHPASQVPAASAPESLPVKAAGIKIPSAVKEPMRAWNRICGEDTPFSKIKQVDVDLLIPLTQACLQDVGWLDDFKFLLEHIPGIPFYTGGVSPIPPYQHPFVATYRFWVKDGPKTVRAHADRVRDGLKAKQFNAKRQVSDSPKLRRGVTGGVDIIGIAKKAAEEKQLRRAASKESTND